MEKYPDYLVNEPKALVFLTGVVESEPDIHNKLIKILEFMSSKDSNNSNNNNDNNTSTSPVSNKDFSTLTIGYRGSVSPDYVYPNKKQFKEFLTVDGILKNNWLLKYYDILPSVLIFTISFSVEWPPAEWARKVSAATEKFNKFKSTIGIRDIKIILIVVRIGSGSMDKDVMDDRTSALKKQLSLDNKTFFFINPSDFNQINSSSSEISSIFKKINKSVKEFSFNYYTSLIKKWKASEKLIVEKYSESIEVIFRIRYYFKIGYIYEFLKQGTPSQKYFKQCYQLLCHSVDVVEDAFYDQIKAVAEMVHFKICMYLFNSNSVTESFQQFKTHMNKFVPLKSEFLWKHYTWISEQYVVFSQLLDKYGVSESIPDADRVYYYHNAAIYSQRRQNSFEMVKQDLQMKSTKLSNDQQFTNTFRGMILIPPKFYGSSLQLSDPILDQIQPVTNETILLFEDYSKEQENLVDHNNITMKYYNLAYDRIPPAANRRRGFILSLIAEQYMKISNFESALNNLLYASKLMTTEKWIEPLIGKMTMIIKCAILLGRPVEYLNAGLFLYANADCNILGILEIEEIHLNIMSLIRGTLFNESNNCLQKNEYVENSQKDHQLFNDKSNFTLPVSEFTVLPDRPDYGSYASKNKPVEYCLSNNYVIEMSQSFNKMFDIKVSYNKPIVELGESVTVILEITSKFVDNMIFDEMLIYFSENTYVKSFINKDSKLVPKKEDSESVCLKLEPQQSKIFEFVIFITEESFSKVVSNESLLCIDKIELCLVNVIGNETKTVIFDVSVLPDDIVRARINQGKYSLKDIIRYCYCDSYPVLQIQKPTPLLKLVGIANENISAIKGFIQRIDITMEIGDIDMIDTLVYLTSDYIPSSSSSYLFYYPNRDQLKEFLSSESSDRCDVVFNPIIVNNVMQPQYCIQLKSLLTANSSFTFPLFLKYDYNNNNIDRVNIKLRVEFMPSGILKMPLSKEFVVKVLFHSPFEMIYESKLTDSSVIGCNNIINTIDSNQIKIIRREKNLVKISINCINSLKNYINIVASELCIRDPLLLYSEDCESTIDNNSCISKDDHQSFIVKKGDIIDKNYIFIYSHELVPPTDIQSSSIGNSLNPKPYPLSTDSASPGSIKLKVKFVEAVELLFGNELLNNFYILSPPRESSAKSFICVEENIKATIYSEINYPLHPLKLINPPLVVLVSCPSILILGEIFKLEVRIENLSNSSERMKINVPLTDEFIVSGTSAVEFEVQSKSFVIYDLFMIPTKNGHVYIPDIVITRDLYTNSSNNNSKNTGIIENNSNRKVVFVHPFSLCI